MAITLKNISKEIGLFPSMEKIINKYRTVNTDKVLTEKEDLIKAIIIDLIKSSGNAGYQFTADTIRRRFYDISSKKLDQALLEYYKKLDEFFDSASDSPDNIITRRVLKTIDSIDGKNYINDDIILKICGYITVTTDLNLLPLAQPNGKYLYRCVKENKFFYAKAPKEPKAKISDSEKILAIANDGKFSKEELKNLLTKLAEKFNAIEGDKISLAIAGKVDK